MAGGLEVHIPEHGLGLVAASYWSFRAKVGFCPLHSNPSFTSTLTAKFLSSNPSLLFNSFVKIMSSWMMYHDLRLPDGRSAPT